MREIVKIGKENDQLYVYRVDHMRTTQSRYPVTLTTFMGEWRPTIFKHRAQRRTYNSSEIAPIMFSFADVSQPPNWIGI